MRFHQYTLCFFFVLLYNSDEGGDLVNILICDDDVVYLSTIKEKVENWAQRAGKSAAIKMHFFQSSEDLLEAWGNGLKADLFLLDIQIPGEMNGLALAKHIHETDYLVPIVLITNYGEFVYEGYRVSALRYLRKPVQQDEIDECMNIAWRQMQAQDCQCIVLDNAAQVLRIPARSILYLEASGHHVIVHMADQNEDYAISQKLSIAKKQLPSQLFVQCHRSFIVNLMYVRRFISSSITLTDGTDISLGRKWKLDFVDAFRNYYLEE